MAFERHFSREDLEALLDGDFKLPDDFLFGVANAGFQVEGGYNGPGEPLNNWVLLERSGNVEPSGEAIRFWREYQEEVEMAAGMGLNGFRMGLEWARVQPQTSLNNTAVPPFDHRAIEGYSDIVAAVMNAGMEPVVTLHHFVHPYWAGIDFWLDASKLELFEAYVLEVVRALNKLLVEKHGLRPVRFYVTINEPNVLALLTYQLRYFPHEKKGRECTITAWNNLIDGHCRAYDAVHSVYRDNGWERPMVSYNTLHLSPYYLDKSTTDLLNARRNGVARDGLASYLEEGRALWEEEIGRIPAGGEASLVGRLFENRADALTRRVFTVERFQHAVDAIYASPRPEKMDFLGVDFYDPFIRHIPKLPTIQDLREKRFNFNHELWEQVHDARAFYHFLKAETTNGAGLPVYIMENGMCHKVYKGRVDPRPDGLTRDRFLQTHLFEVMRALKDGVPLRSYFYWTMVDNYEWGSYEPRFGLYTVDRTQSPVRISTVDAWGIDAAGVYADLVGALRSGDRERIIEAFTRDYW